MFDCAISIDSSISLGIAKVTCHWEVGAAGSIFTAGYSAWVVKGVVGLRTDSTGGGLFLVLLAVVSQPKALVALDEKARVFELVNVAQVA